MPPAEPAPLAARPRDAARGRFADECKESTLKDGGKRVLALTVLVARSGPIGVLGQDLEGEPAVTKHFGKAQLSTARNSAQNLRWIDAESVTTKAGAKKIGKTSMRLRLHRFGFGQLADTFMDGIDVEARAIQLRGRFAGSTDSEMAIELAAAGGSAGDGVDTTNNKPCTS